MISSMPAIQVRGNRTKKEGSIGYFSRPHKLSLHFRPPLAHHQVTPTPSPMNSPQGVTTEGTQQHHDSGTHSLARLIAGKRLFFQLSVLLPLAGALLLFIGLIQLVPGAESKHYGKPLIILGSILVLLGFVLIIIRLFCKWQLEHCETTYLQGGVLPEIKVNEPSLNDVDIEKAGGELEPSSYSQQQTPTRKTSQPTNPATTSMNFSNRSDTTALEQVQVNTPGAYSSSKGGGGGGGAAPVSSSTYYNPLKYCNPHP